MAALFYIGHYDHPAQYNMAFDEWLFERVIKNPNHIYLRLYSWTDKGGITFGFNQKIEKAVDLSQVDSMPVIRRITGGRAIYHDPSELTYSVALNSRLWSGEGKESLSKSSEKIAEMLVLFLEKAGIQSHYVRKSSPQNARPDFFHSQPCFESFAKYELSSADRKVIASAQRRYQSFLLQHGSIKLAPPVYHAALQANSVKEKRSSVLTPLSKDEFKRFEKYFIASAEEFFGMETLDLSLSEKEQEELDTVIKIIKNNALKKRDIIKQKSS